MKKLTLLLLAIAFTFSLTAQQQPHSKTAKNCFITSGILLGVAIIPLTTVSAYDETASDVYKVSAYIALTATIPAIIGLVFVGKDREWFSGKNKQHSYSLIANQDGVGVRFRF